MWQVQLDGTRLPRACLNHPKLVDHFLNITAICHQHGFAGMFIDEPQMQVCFCDHCRSCFEAAANKSLAESQNTPAYLAFQKDTVVRYVSQVCQGIKGLDPALKTMACVMPTVPHDELFEPVATIENLDLFGTDPYWLLSDRFSFNMSLAEAVAVTHRTKQLCIRQGKASQVWLNCWKIPAGRELEIYSGGKALAQVGCDSFYTWSFRGGLGTYEECDDAETAWSSVVRLYRELAGLQ
jgi:hypothetical protein